MGANVDAADLFWNSERASEGRKSEGSRALECEFQAYKDRYGWVPGVSHVSPIKSRVKQLTTTYIRPQACSCNSVDSDTYSPQAAYLPLEQAGAPDNDQLSMSHQILLLDPVRNPFQPSSGFVPGLSQSPLVDKALASTIRLGDMVF